MKTRSIQARFWDDEFVANATWQARFIFIYLLTNPYINICSIFQLPDKKIILETGLSDEDFKIGKEELLEHKKILFCNGWVYVVNAFKNNRYWKAPTNWKAWEEEFSKINKEALAYFNTTTDTNIYTDQNTEISRQKATAASKKKAAGEYEEVVGEDTEVTAD